MKKKTVAVIESKTIIVRTPNEMISEALAKGQNLETLKELLALRKDFEANEARKVFASSFATVQSKITAVTKNKSNPQTHSKYADLNDILVSAKPVYTQEGFSVIFYEGDTTVEGCVRIYADVLHRAGHKETYHYDMPLDGVGIQGNPNMTKIHAKASSVSYGRRYLMCMIWNIPTQDNDAQGIGKIEEYIGDKELNILRDNFIDLNISEKKFCEYMKIENLEKMVKSDYPKALAAINAKRKQKEDKK